MRPIKRIQKESSRKATFRRRTEGLKKKLREFSTLCGIDVCMIMYDSSSFDSASVQTWPEDQTEVGRILHRFQMLPHKEGDKPSENASCFLRAKNQILHDQLTLIRSENKKLKLELASRNMLESKVRRIEGFMASPLPQLVAPSLSTPASTVASEGMTIDTDNNIPDYGSPCNMPELGAAPPPPPLSSPMGLLTAFCPPPPADEMTLPLLIPDEFCNPNYSIDSLFDESLDDALLFATHEDDIYVTTSSSCLPEFGIVPPSVPPLPTVCAAPNDQMAPLLIPDESPLLIPDEFSSPNYSIDDLLDESFGGAFLFGSTEAFSSSSCFPELGVVPPSTSVQLPLAWAAAPNDQSQLPFFNHRSDGVLASQPHP